MGSTTLLLPDSRRTIGRQEDLEWAGLDTAAVRSWSPLREDSCCVLKRSEDAGGSTVARMRSFQHLVGFWLLNV